jgi:hypothetical protein
MVLTLTRKVVVVLEVLRQALKIVYETEGVILWHIDLESNDLNNVTTKIQIKGAALLHAEQYREFTGTYFPTLASDPRAGYLQLEFLNTSEKFYFWAQSDYRRCLSVHRYTDPAEIKKIEALAAR